MLQNLLLLSASCGALMLLYVAALAAFGRRETSRPWLDRLLLPVFLVGFPFFFLAFALLMNLSAFAERRFPRNPLARRAASFVQSMK